MHQRYVQVLAYLLEKGEEGATASEIASRFGLDVGVVLNRLGDLRDRGWITNVGARRWFVYKLTPEAKAAIKPHVSQVSPEMKGRFWVWLGLAVLLVFLLNGEDPEKGGGSEKQL